MTRQHAYARRLASMCVLTLAAGLASSEPANAGSYNVRSCNVPGFAPTTVALWQWENAGYTAPFNDCAAGGGFGLDALWLTRSTDSEVLIARPTAGPRSAIRIRRVRLWLIARLDGYGSSMYVLTRTNTPAGVEQTVLYGKPGADTRDRPYETPLLPEGATRFRVVLACSVNHPDDCHPASQRQLDIKGAEITLAEDVPPAIELRSGTLASDGPQVGTRTIGYAVTDKESGVLKVEGLLGDTVVGTRDLSGVCSYAELNACPAADADELVVDTRAVPDGSYAFRLRVTDAAGNRVATPMSHPVVINNGGTVNSNVRLTARFLGNGRSTTTSRYRRRIAIRGRLTDVAGRAIPKAGIQVIERHAQTGANLRARQVSTDTRGRFGYRVRATGPSRSIRLEYAAKVHGEDALGRRTLHLRVQAASALRVGLRGVRVRYAGRVISRPIPSRGKLVVMQGRVPGGSWQTFATKRTNRRGRFSGGYHLRVYRPGVTLQFRVRVPRERGYPYATGYGRIVTKKVR